MPLSPKQAQVRVRAVQVRSWRTSSSKTMTICRLAEKGKANSSKACKMNTVCLLKARRTKKRKRTRKKNTVSLDFRRVPNSELMPFCRVVESKRNGELNLDIMVLLSPRSRMYAQLLDQPESLLTNSTLQTLQKSEKTSLKTTSI